MLVPVRKPGLGFGGLRADFKDLGFRVQDCKDFAF